MHLAGVRSALSSGTFRYSFSNGFILKKFFSETLEVALMGLTFMIAVFSFVTSFLRHHRKTAPVYLLCIGGGILFLKNFVAEDAEWMVLLFGVGLVILSHGVNLYLCKKCLHCNSALNKNS